MSGARRLAAAFGVLMLLATAAFAIGVSIEKHNTSGDTISNASHAGEGTESPEQGETGHSGGGEASQSHTSEKETIAGIDVESTPLIVLAVVVSAGLAVAALARPRWWVFALALAFCVAFAALDGRELAQRLNENAGDVATFGALALVLHLSAAAVAAFGVVRGRARRTASAAA